MSRKSKRAKALDITPSVRKKVFERSKGRCETCSAYCNDMVYSNSHYIKRSAGGLGVEQNILHQCIECHRKMDFGNKQEREHIMKLARLVLVRHYGEFEDIDLKYKKGM